MSRPLLSFAQLLLHLEKSVRKPEVSIKLATRELRAERIDSVGIKQCSRASSLALFFYRAGQAKKLFQLLQNCDALVSIRVYIFLPRQSITQS